jgi:hypothetical protein
VLLYCIVLYVLYVYMALSIWLVLISDSITVAEIHLCFQEYIPASCVVVYVIVDK